MATIYKIKNSSNWYISYFVNGKRISKSLKTNDRTLAAKEKKKVEKDDEDN